MKNDLYAYLVGLEGMAAQVGSGAAARIGWGTLRQGSPTPRLMLRVVTGRDEKAMSGKVNLGRRRIEFNCWADTAIQAEALAAVVRTLDATRFTQGSTRFAVFVDDEGDAYDADTPAPDKLFGIRLDLDVWHATNS